MERGLALEVALVRNVILVSSLALFFHNAGARAIPYASAPKDTVDIVWLALMSGGAAVVALVGVPLQVSVYWRAVAAGDLRPNESLVVLMYATMAAIVLLFGIAYPVMFVAIH